MDFLLVLMNFFAVTAQAPYTSENRLKIGVLQGGGYVSAKFPRRRDVPTNQKPMHFTRYCKSCCIPQLWYWCCIHHKIHNV